MLPGAYPRVISIVGDREPERAERDVNEEALTPQAFRQLIGLYLLYSAP
jgi:hypothetical protein